jgi:peptidoglycan/xylan/chitin deacetylase (PgdA/CDA1 family)
MATEWPLILSLHHLSDGARSRYVLPVARLEALLVSLLDRGATAITLSEAVATGPHGDGSAAENTFTLTFDDALASFSAYGLPLLERLELCECATVFAPTAFVGGTNEWAAHPTPLQRMMPWRDVLAPLMSWEQLAEASAAGVSVQAHGHSHLPMQRLTRADAREDASTCKRILAENGFETRFFALPFGWRSAEAKAGVADAGFEAAFSVKRGGSDRYEIRRVPIYGTDGGAVTRLKLSGGYFRAFDTFGRHKVAR